MPTFRVISYGICIQWITLKYTEDPPALVRIGRLSLPSSMGAQKCTFQEVKQEMIVIVRHLMSIMSCQVQAAAEYSPEELPRKIASHI